MANRVRQRLVTLFAFLVGFHALLAFGLPPWILGALLATLALWCWRAGWRAALASTLSLAAAAGLLELGLQLTPAGDAWFYRPHEALAVWDYGSGYRRYRELAQIRMRMPHGDLQNLTRRQIAQPRDVVFKTDALGYRNDAHEHCDWLLLGDSFVAGLGDTQSALLQSVLLREHGIRACNLGFTGDPTDYRIRLADYRRRTGSTAPVALFLFEGNDLPDRLDTPGERRPSRFALFWKRYYRLFSQADVYRFTGSLVRRAMRAGSLRRSEQVIFRQHDDFVMAFYVPYERVVAESRYEPTPSVAQQLVGLVEEDTLVFFVPVKSRVYGPLFQPGLSFPPARWAWLEDLCTRNGLDCTDLTPILTATAARMFSGGDYVWWADDTHWNYNGMVAAAEAVARVIQSREYP